MQTGSFLFGAALLLTACANPGAPFWRVEVAGETSHLLGTMHRGVPADELPASVWRALAEARLLYTEADVRSINTTEFANLVSLPDGETVQGAVTPEEWLLLVDGLAGLVNAHQLDTLQPWFTHGALIGSYLPEGEEMDEALVLAAEGHGTELAFFETWQHQAGLLNDLGVEDGVIPLLEAVRDPEQTQALLEEWMRAYGVPELETLESLALDPDDIIERPRYFEEILFNRNRQWSAALEAELATGGVLVAVGFAHCLGEEGLVAELRAEGATVELVR